MSLLRYSVFSWILILFLTPFTHATEAVVATQEKKAVTATKASKIHHDAFSPFEATMDALANQHGADSAFALLELTKIERSIASLDDLAVFRAYQCYLNSFLKNNTGIDESILFLQKSVRENPLNYSMLAAIELCQSYREPETQKKELHLISAFQHVSSAQAATLRYWISTDFVMLATSQGRARDAIDAAQIALAVAEENRDSFRIAKSLRALAFIEIDMGKNKEALDHISSAIDIIQRMSTREEELNFLVNKGYILTSMKKFSEAKIVFRSAMKMATEFNDLKIVATIRSNFADIANQEGKYLDAKKYSAKVREYALKENDLNMEAYSLMSFALAEIYLGNNLSGEKAFDKAVKHFQDHKMMVDLRDYHGYFSDAQAKVGNYSQAYTALIKKNEFALQIEKESRGNRAQELREQINAKQKATEIETLKNTNARQLAESELAKLSAQRGWLFSALLFITLIFSALALFLVRKKNQYLDQRNQFLDIQRFQDALTGLYNRRYLIEQQPSFWQQSIETMNRGECTALLMIDIDHFKKINDVHGHAAGDAALIEIAKRLKISVRASHTVIRWGGEEFLAFVDAPTAEVIEILATRILHEFRKSLFQFNGKDILLSASIGYILLPMKFNDKGYFDIEESQKLADAALYLAKNNGRNRAAGITKININNPVLGHLTDTLLESWKSGDVEMTISHGPK